MAKDKSDDKNNKNEDVESSDSGLMSRPYAGNETRLAQDEKELAEMEGRNNESEEEDDDSDLPPAPKKATANDPEDEQLWHKRYGDLRRHAQKQKKEFEDRISSLETELEKRQKQVPLPKTQEELDEWAETYPDAYAVFRTLLIKERENIQKSVRESEESSEKTVEELKKELGMEKLRNAHPDVDELQNDTKFHDWVDAQGEIVADIIYGGDDWRAVAREISVYKDWLKSQTEEEEKPARRRKRDADAVKDTNVPSSGTPSEGAKLGDYIRESEIDRMTSAEYERREKEIDEAISKGRIIYDLTDPQGAQSQLDALR